MLLRCSISILVTFDKYVRIILTIQICQYSIQYVCKNRAVITNQVPLFSSKFLFNVYR